MPGDWPAVSLASTGSLGQRVARRCAKDSGASHALAVLVSWMPAPTGADFGGTISVAHRRHRGHRLAPGEAIGGRDWVRAGAAELGLDCLRRHLLGLPVDERIDFERR